MSDKDNIYFAAKEAKKTASVLMRKADEWFNVISASGYKDKLKNVWRCYYGSYYNDVGNAHQIAFGGGEGEMVQFPINHIRNLGQHIKNMTIANRPTLEARAANTDYKSLVQTKLANGILDYYIREKHIERHLEEAVETAIVLGAGYIKVGWNSMAGELVDGATDDSGETIPIFQGEIEFSNLSPFDVVVDGTKETDEHDWKLVRTWKNKYDLASKYPEHADKIISLQTKADLQQLRFGFNSLNFETDDVPVYEFFHKKTESMSKGRYLIFLTEEIVLHDLPMPYRFIPVLKMSAGRILGTPFDYTSMFDLLPIQEAVNMLYSTIITNQHAFGVQNLAVPSGSGVNIASLTGGLNVIEYNAQNGKIEAINLTHTPAEIFKFLEMLEHLMETISGINSVARGNPEASLKTGVALALIQAQALQFLGGLQKSYVYLLEDVGNSIVKILQDYADEPRLIAIAGKDNRTEMREFVSDDISNISRVIVDVSNPLSKTLAGRMELASQLMQYGNSQNSLLNAKQFITLANTGSLEVVTDEVEDEMLYIKKENESIVDGETPPVMAFDNHKEHILGHKRVSFDPNLRKDAALMERLTMHVQAHIDELRMADPAVLITLGQEPMPMVPPPMGGPAPTGVEGIPIPSEGQEGMVNTGEEITAPMIEGGVNMPNMPGKPPGFEDVPLSAAEMPIQG